MTTTQQLLLERIGVIDHSSGVGCAHDSRCWIERGSNVRDMPVAQRSVAFNMRVVL
jgi:hypothetical protein